MSSAHHVHGFCHLHACRMNGFQIPQASSQLSQVAYLVAFKHWYASPSRCDQFGRDEIV